MRFSVDFRKFLISILSLEISSFPQSYNSWCICHHPRNLHPIKTYQIIRWSYWVLTWDIYGSIRSFWYSTRCGPSYNPFSKGNKFSIASIKFQYRTESWSSSVSLSKRWRVSRALVFRKSEDLGQAHVCCPEAEQPKDISTWEDLQNGDDNDEEEERGGGGGLIRPESLTVTTIQV